jgi:hypothetical protein
MNMANAIKSALASTPPRPIIPRRHLNPQPLIADANPEVETRAPATTAKSLETGAATSSQNIQPNRPRSTSTEKSANFEPEVELVSSSSVQPNTKRAEDLDKNRAKNKVRHVAADTGELGTAVPLELLNEQMPAFWASRINEHVSSAVSSLVATGLDFLAAKEKLEHGEFQGLFNPGVLKIDQRTAQKLMNIARHPVLSKTANWSFLPVALNSLAALSRIEEKRLQRAIEKGKVSPGMTIKDAVALVTPRQRVPATPIQHQDAASAKRPAVNCEPPLPKAWTEYLADFLGWIREDVPSSPEHVGGVQAWIELFSKEIQRVRATIPMQKPPRKNAT